MTVTGQCEGSKVDRPIHVLHVIASLNRGGAETALSRLIEHSDRERLRHTVLMLKGGGALVPNLERTGALLLDAGLRRGPFNALELVRVVRAARRLSPDVLQGWMVHGNLAAWMLRALVGSGCALAWNLRLTANNLHERWLTRALTSLAARLSRRVDLLISNSEAGLAEHLHLGYAPRSQLVVPNGFDLERFKPDDPLRASIRSQWGVKANDVLFGIVGRRHAQKAHEIFLEAAGTVIRTFPATKFVLVGDGLLGDTVLNSMIQNFGLGAHTLVLDGRDDVYRLLPALDVLCLSSLYEGFPNVIGEAMAASVPCVATDVSDVRKIVGDAGLVVPPGDPIAFAEAMLAVIEMGPAGRRRMGAAGRERVLQHYSIDGIAAQYEQIYRLLTSTRRATRANRHQRV